jgi:GTP-binding protein
MSPAEIVNARFLASARKIGELPPPVGVEIAFAGRSNVGKSSLLNSLMARRSLARTSSTPGCTRGLTFFEAEARDGLRLVLVDLPGYGYAARSRTEREEWGELIEGFLRERSVLKATALLVDSRRGMEAEEFELLDFLAQSRPATAPLQVVLVATKLDKVPRAQRSSALAAIRRSSGRDVVGFSTELSETTTDVWRSLRQALA